MAQSISSIPNLLHSLSLPLGNKLKIRVNILFDRPNKSDLKTEAQERGLGMNQDFVFN